MLRSFVLCRRHARIAHVAFCVDDTLVLHTSFLYRRHARIAYVFFCSQYAYVANFTFVHTYLLWRWNNELD